MPGLKRLRSARIIAAGHAFIQIIAAGHAFMQNLRRRQYDDVADEPPLARVRTAFDQACETW
jgi:dienelactone hydrolase